MASLKNSDTGPSAAPRPVVYVGPNMGADVPMQQFTTFSGGLSPVLQARCEQDPDFAALFVPVAGLAAARAALSRPGSELNRAFSSVWSAYAAKRKEGK